MSTEAPTTVEPGEISVSPDFNPYAPTECNTCEGYGYETYVGGKQNGYVTIVYTGCRICEGCGEICRCPVCTGWGYEGKGHGDAAARPTRRCGGCKGRGVVPASRFAELAPPLS